MSKAAARIAQRTRARHTAPQPPKPVANVSTAPAPFVPFLVDLQTGVSRAMTAAEIEHYEAAWQQGQTERNCDATA